MSAQPRVRLTTAQNLILLLSLPREGGITCMATLHAKPSPRERRAGTLEGVGVMTTFAELTSVRVEPASDGFPDALWIGRTAFDLPKPAADAAREWIAARLPQAAEA